MAENYPLAVHWEMTTGTEVLWRVWTDSWSSNGSAETEAEAWEQMNVAWGSRLGADDG